MDKDKKEEIRIAAKLILLIIVSIVAIMVCECGQNRRAAAERSATEIVSEE